MKRTAAILFLLATIAAQARPVWVYPPEERVRWYAPPDAVVDAAGQRWLDPTASKLTECGWHLCEIGNAAVNDCVVDFNATPTVRPMTDQELDAREAARLEAEAQAAALEGLPEVFPNGIATIDADGHHVEHISVGDGMPVLGIQVSNSPLTKEEKDARKAAGKAAWETRKKEAKAAKSDKERLAIVMQALFGITEEKSK